jgi:hypothetical protein
LQTQEAEKGSQGKASRPTDYNIGRESTMSFDNTSKQIHNIDFNECGSLENWEKTFAPPSQPENRNRAIDTKKEYHHPRGGYIGRG